MVDRSTLSATDYNRIKLFQDQVHTIPYEHLHEIGNLYTSYNVHLTYGVGILHRHFFLDQGCIMVHMAQDRHVDICRPHQLNSLRSDDCYRPDSFLLNDDLKFQPYEYSLDLVRSAPPEAFLLRLRSYLTQHDLKDVVAIIPKPDTGNEATEVVEIIFPKSQIMKTSPVRDIGTTAAHGLRSATTGWVFNTHEGGKLEILEIKKCDPLPTGLHKVYDGAQVL